MGSSTYFKGGDCWESWKEPDARGGARDANRDAGAGGVGAENRGGGRAGSPGDGAQPAEAQWKLNYAYFPSVRGPRGPAGVPGTLTSVLQERCRRLSPRQYLPPIVGLEGTRGQ